MQNLKILGAIGQNTPFESNMKVPDTEGQFISEDAEGSSLNVYRKMVTDSGRIPDPVDPSKTVQTITVTRTLLSNQ